MQLRSLAVAAGMLAALTVVHPATAQAGGYEKCKDYSFTPGSTVDSGGYGAKNIRQSGTTCRIARKVAAGAEAGQGDPKYSAKGFVCTAGRSKGDFQRPYSCTKKARGSVVARVRFLAVGVV